MITEPMAEKALEYLKSTDVGAAKAKAYMDLLEDQKKTILAVEFMKAEGSQGEKAKVAEASKDYADRIQKLHDSRYDWEKTRNLRRSAELQIEMWRSQNANMRKGNI